MTFYEITARPDADERLGAQALQLRDALTRQRTDGALVRLITPVYPNEDVAQAEVRLTAFTVQIVPVLEYPPI